MLSVADARTRILDGVTALGAEWVLLDRALDRVLAGDLEARRTQPPTAVSAMDGYAVRAADTDPPGRWLRVTGHARAGGAAVAGLAPGEAVRIFTGAALPDGADAVAVQENAELEAGRVRFSRACRPAEFVRPAGLDFAAGWPGLRAGTLLGPRALGLAASMGHVWLPVRRRPRVAILATGDELARPGDPAGPGMIVASSSITLAALIRRYGGEPVDLGIAPDDLAATRHALAHAGGVDLLLTTGGASVGEHDLVRQALEAEGATLDFWKIAMRPGKPMMFGRLGTTPVLGMPGNPVSAAVCTLLFVRAHLRALMGLDPALPRRVARSTTALRANDEREDYLRASRVARDDGVLWLLPATCQDSSMTATLAAADALIVRAPHAPELAAGAEVEVHLLAEAERLG